MNKFVAALALLGLVGCVRVDRYKQVFEPDQLALLQNTCKSIGGTSEVSAPGGQVGAVKCYAPNVLVPTVSGPVQPAGEMTYYGIPPAPSPTKHVHTKEEVE